MKSSEEESLMGIRAVNTKTADGSGEKNADALIKRHRRRRFLRVIAVVVAVVAVLIVIAAIRSNMTFSGYTITKTIETESNGSAGVVEFCDGILKYSQDGITYINGREAVWNSAFEMGSPILDVCGKYAAITDESSGVIYLFNEDGKVSEINTSYPVVKIEVAKQGVVAALMEDGTTNYIEVYDKTGEVLVTEKTVLDGSGYPVDFSISQDATKMAVSYVCVSSGVMESKVLFYNFSDVGQNEVDRMVGGFNQYDSSVVPVVEFTDNDTVIAIGDDVISVYSMDETPVLEDEISINDEICQVFYSEKYIGLVTENTDNVNPYIVTIYNMSLKEVSSFEISRLSERITFDDNTVMMFSDGQLLVTSFSGKVRFESEFTSETLDIVPASGKYKYLLINTDSIEKIRLK